MASICHRSQRERIHLTLIDEAIKGLDDVRGGRTMSVAEARAIYPPGTGGGNVSNRPRKKQRASR